jgi:predicted lipid-binding transport protein (Tim44 family)
MHRFHAIVSIAAVVLSASAAVAEPVAYPAKGQSADQQNRDEYECHQSAQNETGVDPVALAEQSSSSKPSSEAKSGVGSGLSGAGIGAMRGAASGDPGEGALHGAGMGRLIAVIRSRRQMEKQKQDASTQDSEQHAQLEKYDVAYTTCLTGRGYTVK